MIYLPKNIKKFINETISDVDIFAFYLGISELGIYKCLHNSHYKIRNLHRGDKHPSLSFYYKNDKVYAIDYASSQYSGDAIAIAGTVLGLNCNNNKDFIKITEHIIKHLIPRTNDNTVVNDKLLKKHLNSVIIDKTTFIQFNIHQKYNNKIKKYWSDINVDVNDLYDEYTYLVDKAWVNDKLIYEFNPDDPMYAHYLGLDEIPRYKLYKPYGDKKKNKFITNYRLSIGQLFKLYRKYDIIIISKSSKDISSIKFSLEKLNVDRDICYLPISSESLRLPINIVDLLRNKSNHIISITDNDKTGIEFMNYHKKHFNFITYTPTVDDFSTSIRLGLPVDKELKLIINNIP